MFSGEQPSATRLSMRLNKRGGRRANYRRDTARLKIQCVIHTALKQIGRRVDTGQCQPDARSIGGKQTAEELREVANKSLTQTLSRSINTSITTFIMVVMLYILGVASIRDFSLPLMAGLVCGAYSSICIATELWYVMKVHFGKNKATK
jgi:hypothetical protein